MPADGYRICYFISGHGYGHATRSSQIINALLEIKDTTVTVCTTAPRHLFTESSRLVYRYKTVGYEIAQSSPYTIDLERSLEALTKFATEDASSQERKAEASFIQASKFDAVLADAAFPVAVTDCHVPIILVTNFTFDTIFTKLLEYVKHQADYTAVVESITRSCRKVYGVIKLPGFTDFPLTEAWSRTDIQERVINAPLVYRPALKSREAVLDDLNLPKDKKILLLQFGGHALAHSDIVPSIPESWMCLASQNINSPQFYQFPADAYVPDLVAASDLVLGKIGYGTVSECVGMGKPLLYVARPMFAEEPCLLEYLHQNGTCLEMSRQDFEHGQWSAAIEDVMSVAATHKQVDDGSSAVARMIETMITKAMQNAR